LASRVISTVISSRCQIGDAEPTSVYAAERGRKLSIAADQVRL
jgi:hypothetical protein